MALFDIETTSRDGEEKRTKFAVNTDELQSLISTFDNISKAFDDILRDVV